MEFILAASAAATAGAITNPLEVIKTRMQLQGELVSKGKAVIHYKNLIHAGYVISKTEGLRALQKGLLPTMGMQFLMNGSRLGFYEFFLTRGFVTDEEGKIVFWRNVVFSGIGGVAGQILASPFYMVKTHLQSQAAKNIAVGFQHKHQGTWDAFKTIYQEQGVKGLFRGAGASVPRALAGSVSQLTSFYYTKEWLSEFKYFRESPVAKTFVAGMVGGIAISVTMQPFDLILTRLYNQGVDANGKGLLYKSFLDCVIKIHRTEGFLAFYKGLGPLYFRLGPHSVIFFLIYDAYKNLYGKIRNSVINKLN